MQKENAQRNIYILYGITLGPHKTLNVKNKYYFFLVFGTKVNEYELLKCVEDEKKNKRSATEM